VDCKVTETWADDGGCSTSCGGGQQKQKLSVTTEPKHGGKTCPSLRRSMDCNKQACPTCSAGDDITNGKAESNNGPLNAVTEGGAVSYKCRPGYHMRGDAVRPCKKVAGTTTTKLAGEVRGWWGSTCWCTGGESAGLDDGGTGETSQL
jgi:hypothetical protein